MTIFGMQISSEILTAVAAILLSLVLNYVPGLNVKWAALAKEAKQLVMLLLITIVAAASLGLSCAGLFQSYFSIPCTQAGAEFLVVQWIIAAVANQTIYKLSPQLKSVRMVWNK